MNGVAADGGTRRLSVLREGAAAAWPVCLGYMPIGLALGVLGQKAGLEPWQVGAMSVVVFAGSSQFIAVAMIASGAASTAIIGTTFLVNLRHLLMGSALARHLADAKIRFLALFAYGITDESFAVNLGNFREGGWDRRRALVMNHTANAAWVASTVAGALVGEFLPPGVLGISYALTAMFLALLVYQLRERLHVLVALAAGALSVLLHGVLPRNGNVLAATLAAATMGLFLRMRKGRG
ncbi:MAG TPA: AzlC family ABC transporter permease [Verrucomicrobiae bacterium]|nr:AzlC family ABC transporter permease [Verrucomicrobiae bacterium]